MTVAPGGRSFVRHPAPRGSARELLVPAGDVELSGLLTEPPDGAAPRALVVAVHGAGMHAGYFDAVTAPGLSLLELGRELGYAVWAPDRPGYGASADLDDERLDLFSQAHLLLAAVESFRAERAVGAGVVLVGHSYGLKVAFATVAEAPPGTFLGLDGAGSGLHYGFEWAARRAGTSPKPPPGDRGDMWGPESLYPPETFRRGALPLHRTPAVQAAESPRWPDDFRAMAPRITVPVQLTFGEHERLWRTDDEHFDELRSLLAATPRCSITVQAGAGHNVSLGWTAREYHRAVLAFAGECAQNPLNSGSRFS